MTRLFVCQIMTTLGTNRASPTLESIICLLMNFVHENQHAHAQSDVHSPNTMTM